MSDDLVWRELDASKNSIQMAARAVFSHKETDNKNTKMLQEMLFKEHGINWNDYPASFKRGTYARRITREGRFEPWEIEALPEKHRARRDPTATFSRSSVEVVALPKILSITNREAVFFEGADPIEATVPTTEDRP